MPHSKNNSGNSPYTSGLPAPLVFRSAKVPANSSYPVHTHDWGEFVYSFSGVMEVRISGTLYLEPSQYCLWLPPRVEHQGLNRCAASHCSIYVGEPFSQRFPSEPCALVVTPLIRALLDHLRQHAKSTPYDEEYERVLRVLIDQLAGAQRTGNYLPTSADPLLRAILEELEDRPDDRRTLAELARAHHTTERTLMRRCQRELGMSLLDWRQRLAVMRAMQWLETGQSVERIALDLGYGSASAFIAMFRRQTDTTPDEYRRSRNHDGASEKGVT